jgi:hypothetical protein
MPTPMSASLRWRSSVRRPSKRPGRGHSRPIFPRNFSPVTQLESARLGIVTPQMKRVAEREPHFEELFPGKGARRCAMRSPRAGW